MRTSRRPQAGFSLTELLIVISIIVVLAGLMFPTFRAALERAHQANCVSNLKQIHVAVVQYRLDNRRYPASLYEAARAGRVLSPGVVVCPDDEGGPADLTRYTVAAGRRVLASSSYDLTDAGVVWNYNGYDATGHDSATVQTGQAHRLSSRRAPVTTIITRCEHHRGATGPDPIDLALRLDGSAPKIRKSQNYDWVNQP